MALDKKTLQKLLDNPAMFSPRDMEMEEESMETPEVMEQPQIEPEEMLEPEVEESVEMDEPAPAPIRDNEIVARLRRLKAGEPIEDEESDTEIAKDTGASVDQRKEALKRIKQKYLGQ